MSLLILIGIVAVLLALTIGSVFVAVVRRISLRARRRRNAKKEKAWESVLFDMFEEASAPAIVSRSERKHFLQFIVRYIFVVKGLYRERLAELAQPYLDALLPLMRNRDPMIRAEAVHLLGVLGPTRFRMHLHGALRDPSPIVAIAAARGLAGADTDYSAEVLSTVQRFDTWDSNFIASVLTSLGSDAATALIEYYSDDRRTSRSRVAAAEALRWLGIADAAPVAARILETTTDRELVAASLRVLRRVGWEHHAPIARRLCHADDFVVRLHAVSALSQLGSEKDVPLLVESMSDPSRWVSIRAARGLHEMGAHDVLRRIAEGSGPASLLARQILA